MSMTDQDKALWALVGKWLTFAQDNRYQGEEYTGPDDELNDAVADAYQECAEALRHELIAVVRLSSHSDLIDAVVAASGVTRAKPCLFCKGRTACRACNGTGVSPRTPPNTGPR